MIWLFIFSILGIFLLLLAAAFLIFRIRTHSRNHRNLDCRPIEKAVSASSSAPCKPHEKLTPDDLLSLQMEQALQAVLESPPLLPVRKTVKAPQTLLREAVFTSLSELRHQASRVVLEEDAHLIKRNSQFVLRIRTHPIRKEAREIEVDPLLLDSVVADTLVDLRHILLNRKPAPGALVAPLVSQGEVNAVVDDTKLNADDTTQTLSEKTATRLANVVRPVKPNEEALVAKDVTKTIHRMLDDVTPAAERRLYAEKDAEDDVDEEDSTFTGLDLPPMFDPKANPEAYLDLLEQERLGKVEIITQYKKDFFCRLILAPERVRDYYADIKHALLSYRGVKSRVSASMETFKYGGKRKIAKINVKGSTVYLYLALSPEEMKDTKFGTADVSDRKKFTSVPLLLKVKGDRKYKYALELVDLLCNEKLQLQKTKKDPGNCHVAPKTLEELIEAGHAKRTVGGIPTVANND